MLNSNEYIGDQRRVKRVCANTQPHQSLYSSHILVTVNDLSSLQPNLISEQACLSADLSVLMWWFCCCWFVVCGCSIGAFVRVCREGEGKEGVYGPCFVVQYLMSFSVLQSSRWGIASWVPY